MLSPVNWRRHDTGVAYFTFEKNLTSFYETGALNFAVDWRCFDMGNEIASTLASHLLCGIDTMSSTG